MVAFLVGAVIAVLAFCASVLKRLIEFFQKHGPAIAGVLRKAAALTDMVSRTGMILGPEHSAKWRGYMKQLRTLRARETLLVHSEHSLHDELVQMEDSMEDKLTPESTCAVM